MEKVFNDPKLEEAYQQSIPVIEAHLKKLNQISEDIKKIEEILRPIGNMKVIRIKTEKGEWAIGWDYQSKRIVIRNICDNNTILLIEAKVYLRMLAYPRLSEFLDFSEESEGK